MKRNCKSIGCFISCCGILVIFALILPTNFWWFMLGAFLFCLGIFIMRK